MFKSKKGLARHLGVRLEELERLALRGTANYRTWQEPKASGGTRTISKPVPRLERVQRRIYDRLLASLPVSENSFGGVRKRSHLDHAAFHCAQECVVRIDIRDCYPSVAPRQVRLLLRGLGCSRPVAELLALLTTVNGGLPQGACTSNALLNQLLRDLDGQLLRVATRLKVRYSRYADDLVFSGKAARDCVQPTIAALAAMGLRVSRSKTRVMPRNRPQVVTGLLVNGSSPSVPAEYRRMIERESWALGRSAASDALRRSFAGKVAYVQRVRPTQGARLAARCKSTQSIEARTTPAD